MGKWALNDAIANSEDFLSFGRLSFGMSDVPMSDVPSTSGQTEVRAFVGCTLDRTCVPELKNIYSCWFLLPLLFPFRRSVRGECPEMWFVGFSPKPFR